ncbi:AAA family ATPase [Salinarimonas rosea]|uniref:AAA family ATPase n=1 Tax=Salinarimonas rosea TaxID=552063 RepID=UPI0003F9D7ED|nr:AAA family ATPase [Salinarimonas rosea]
MIDLDRQCRAAEEGNFTPPSSYIAAGVPIVELDVKQDLRCFCERWAGLRGLQRHIQILLEDAMRSPDVQLLVDIEARVAESLEEYAYTPLHELHERLVVYLALLTDDPARWLAAAQQALAQCASAAVGAELRFRARAFALALVQPRYDANVDAVYQMTHDYVRGMTRIGAERQAALETATERSPGELATLAELARGPIEDDDDGGLELPDDVVEDRAERERDDPPGVVVLERLPASGNSKYGNQSFAEFKDFVGERIPLVPRPDVVTIRETLVAEAPHLAAVVDGILQTVAMSSVVRIRPTLLVGEPGSGKTWLARRIAELCGVPSVVYPAGGVADGTLGGTNRQWHSARPSLPLQLIHLHGIANPAIVVDEVEKASQERRNGALHDVLLSLLEPSSARTFLDPYLEVPCDLSRVSWILTANNHEGLPAPLLDRLRVVFVPAPDRRHAPALIRSVLRDLARERELDPVWIPPCGPDDVGLIERAWAGGSLRKLRRVVEVWLDCQDAPALAH